MFKYPIVLVYYDDFIEHAKENKQVLRFKKLVALLAASYGAGILGLLGFGMFALGSLGLFYLPVAVMDALIILIIKRKHDEIDDQILELNDSISDYKKALFYLNNEKVFTNERVYRRDVIRNSPKMVQKILERNKEVHHDLSVPSINLNSLTDISMKDLKETYKASLQSHGPELVLKPIRNKEKL